MNAKYILQATAIITFISYLLASFTDDIRIFLGVAHQVDLVGMNLAWEVKPLGNRYLFYIIYKLFDFFRYNEFIYSFVVKLFFGILIVAICWYFSKNVEKYFTNIKKDTIFYTTVICVLALHNFFYLQAEWFGLIGTLLAIAIVCGDDATNDFAWKWFFAGIIMVAVASLKGITLLYLPLAIVTLYLLNVDIVKTRLMYFLFGFSQGTLYGFIIMQLLHPPMVADIILSSQIAHSFVVDIPTRLFYFVALSRNIFFWVGCLLIASVLLLVVVYKSNKRILLAGLWLLAASIPIIQSEYFGYHYTPLILPALFTILLSYDCLKDSNNLQIITTSCMLVIFLVFGSVFNTYYTEQQNYYNSLQEHANIINEKFGLPNEPEVIYMDAGNSPYYFRAKSACRYISPLPVQRNLTSTPQYNESLNCIKEHLGNTTYIVSMDSWWVFNYTNSMKSVRPVDYTGYDLVYEAGWQIYKLNRSVLM